MKRGKKSKRKKLIDKLDKIVMEIVRIRDKWTCQWCGKHVKGSNAHCSHVIPRSRGNHLRWDLQNVKLLCFHCHVNTWHKDPNRGSAWFRRTFPERYDYLELERYTDEKFSIADLEAKFEELQEYKNNL